MRPSSPGGGTSISDTGGKLTDAGISTWRIPAAAYPPTKIGNVFERFVKLRRKGQRHRIGPRHQQKHRRTAGRRNRSLVRGRHGIDVLVPAARRSRHCRRPCCGTRLGGYVRGIRYGSRPSILLIAEDDPANYKLFEVMLKKHYTLMHAWNGAKPWRCSRRTVPA